MPDTIENNDKLSTALNEILSNPQMLSAISSMAKSLKSGEEDKSQKETEAQKSEAPTVSAGLPDIINMLSGKEGGSLKQNRRSELLCALKPYLSQERSDAIDKIIRFSELSSIFKELT